MTHHPRTLDVLSAFDSLRDAAKACIALLPESWLMPSSPGRAASTPPLLTVGLLVHHTHHAAAVHLEDHDTLFPAEGHGLWPSAHVRLAAESAVAKVVDAARRAEDALRAFPTLRSGFSFGLSVPQPTAATVARHLQNTMNVHIQAMGSHVTREFERRSPTAAAWEVQRARLGLLLDLLAPFDAEPDGLWVAVAAAVLAEAQNGWHDGMADVPATTTIPHPVVGSFDGNLEAGQSWAWRRTTMVAAPPTVKAAMDAHIPMRLLPAGDVAQATALALAGTVLFAHLWDWPVSDVEQLRHAITCARFGDL